MKLTILYLAAFTIAFTTVSAQQTDTISQQKEITSIEFEEDQYDWGEVKEGEIVTHVFKFTNTGDKPLLITKALGSCGCTVPYFSKLPIMPGEESEIHVEFNSANRPGIQSKRVTIEANTEPEVSILSIRGEVLPKDNPDEENEFDLKKKNDLDIISSTDSNCFAIFPNPTNDILQIELKQNIGQSAEVYIRSVNGQEVLRKKIEKISRETSKLDISSFAPGLYFISIEVNGDRPQTQCFVVSE